MKLLRLAFTLLLALAASLAQAATYTFRSDTFSWETAANAITTWDQTCTNYPGDDDKVTINFTGGFTFTFAGTAYSSVRLLSNGGLQFGADTGFFRTYSNTALPAGTPSNVGGGCVAGPTTNVILGYWIDFNPSSAGSGGVSWEQKGTAPNRYVVFSWNGVYQYHTTTPYTFQIILYENGEFKYQYGNANTTGSNATIGVQISGSDYTQYSYNSGYNANGSAIRWFLANGTPTRRAEYRFDEYSYSGRIGEVVDSSGNSNNGVRVGNATTVAGGYVCRGLSIPADTTSASNAVDTLLDVDSGIGNQGAVTFWYKANAAWNSGSAMLLDATTQTAAPFFLMRQSDGSLRASVTDNNGNVLSAVTSAQSVSAGTWKHVAVSWRLASGSGQSSLRIYINGLQAGAASGTTTGSLDNSLGTLFVGDNRGTAGPAYSSYNSANGVIDEMRVYNYDISAVELTADMNPSHSCPPPLDHYEVWLPTSSLTCLPTTVTVKACSSNSSSCSPEPTANGTAVITSSAGTLGSSVLNFSSGVATTTLSLPGGSDGTAVTVSLSGESTVAANARQCCPNGIACFAANSCSTTFNQAGFIVAAGTGGAETTLTPQTAGTTSATVYLRAVRKSTTTQACEAAVTGSRTVNWAYQCNDPSTCGGVSLMSIDGGTPTAIKGYNASGSPSYTGVTMNFDANGNAPFRLNFADVGKTTLAASFTAANGDLLQLAGTAPTFVTKPAGFSVTNIADAASPFTANPAATSGTTLATDPKFVKAGAPFSARITALTSSGAATPNFGKEATPEGVLLTPTLVQPAGGTTGSLANATVAGTQFTNGVANVANLSYSEVGFMKLTGSIADASYLGAGDVTSTPSANIGRFYPAGFTASYQAPVQRSQLSCSPASTFTYMAEPFQLKFTLTAVNASGTKTQNYDDTLGFARLDLTASGNYRLAGVDGGTQFVSPRLSAVAGSGTQRWVAGVAGTRDASNTWSAGVVLTGTVAAAASPGGPFNASFGVAPVDLDGAAMTTASLNLDADPTVAGNDHALVGQIPLRQGRLRLQNGMSAANRALTLPLAAEYWDSTLGAYTTNSLDSCTAIATANLSFGNYRKTLATSDTALMASPVTLSSGRAALVLKAPASGHAGSVDLAIALAAGSNPADASCLKTATGWTPAIAASSGANVVGLRSAWCGGSNDPGARATWGLYRGSNGIVFQRENY